MSMPGRTTRLHAAAPGKGDNPTGTYKERAIRYRAEAHGLRDAVKRLEGKITFKFKFRLISHYVNTK